MVLIVVSGNKRHVLNVHSAISLEVSRSCWFCNLTPKHIQPLPSAVSQKQNHETHACVLPKVRRQEAGAKALSALDIMQGRIPFLFHVMRFLPE